VTVDTAKNILYTRAKELKDGLGVIIANECRQRNVVIIQRYNAILDRIAKKPVNEKELSDLRDFIELSKNTVDELKDVVRENRSQLALLEYFNITVSMEDMGLAWSTLGEWLTQASSASEWNLWSIIRHF